jgi:hypothetical protein
VFHTEHSQAFMYAITDLSQLVSEVQHHRDTYSSLNIILRSNIPLFIAALVARVAS